MDEKQARDFFENLIDKTASKTAECEQLRNENKKLKSILKELHAIVKGECPCLLEDTSLEPIGMQIEMILKLPPWDK